jgi:hypothetical protein
MNVTDYRVAEKNMTKSNNADRDFGTSDCSSAQERIEYAQRQFFSKLNVLDAVKSGVGLKESIAALPDKDTGCSCWQWLQAIEFYTMKTAPKESERAEKARKLVLERFK